MVVDIDEAAVFEAEEAGALDAVALEEDGGDAGVGDDVGGGGGVMDTLDVGKGAVDEGDGVGDDDVGLAAELVEDLGEREDGADGVAVGAGVGGEDEPGRGAECLQERGDVGFWGHGLGGLVRVVASLLFALAGAGEEFFHAAGHFFGAVDGEGDLRDVAYAHAVA